MLAHLWIGNGYTQKTALSTYDDEKPELITVDDQLSPVFHDAIEGQTVGSRDRGRPRRPTEAFGESGNPQLGIGNKDTGPDRHRPGQQAVLDEPQGTAKDAARLDAQARREGRRAHRPRLHRHARSPTASCGSPPLIKGDGADGRRRARRSGQLPRPGLRRQEAVRRELQHAASRRRSRSAPARSSRAGTRRSSAEGRQPGDPRDPAGATATARRATRTPASRAPTRCTSWSTSSGPPEHHGGPCRHGEPR